MVVDSICQSRSEPKTALPWATKHTHLKMKSMTIVKVVTSSSSPCLGPLGETNYLKSPPSFWGAGAPCAKKTYLTLPKLVISTHLKHISQIGSFPQVGMNIKNLWNHHLAYYTEHTIESTCYDAAPFSQDAAETNEGTTSTLRLQCWHRHRFFLIQWKSSTILLLFLLWKLSNINILQGVPPTSYSCGYNS